MRRAKKGKRLYVFDIRTGITKVCCGYKNAAEEMGLKNVTSISQGLVRGCVLSKRYVVKASKFTKEEKDDIYTKYWSKQPNELITERWREIRPNVWVSTLGRAKKGDEYLYPSLWNNGSIFITIDKVKLNLRRLIVEAFITRRELKKNEIVCSRGGQLSYGADDLYVTTRAKMSDVGARTVSIEIALIGEDGKVIETYKSISEAGRQNYIDNSAIAKAIKKGRTCYGLKFEYMDKYYN